MAAVGTTDAPSVLLGDSYRRLPRWSTWAFAGGSLLVALLVLLVAGDPGVPGCGNGT